MDQWQQYSQPAGALRRQNNSNQPAQNPQAREYSSTSAQPNFGSFEQYQSGARPASQGQSLVSSPTQTPQVRDGNGDVAMQDAGDAHNGLKYPMRPLHQQHLSASGRAGLHGSVQEQSSAAQRYSPMEAVSGASAYQAPPQASQNQYSSRQSPTRPGSYSSSNSYYASRPAAQPLPPITPYSSTNNQDYPQSATTQINQLFGNDPKPPRRPLPQAAAPSGRGPVPHFTKVRSVADLQPKINAQPAFRRANPEGGFISVGLSDELFYLDCADFIHIAAASPHHTPPIHIPHL